MHTFLRLSSLADFFSDLTYQSEKGDSTLLGNNIPTYIGPREWIRQNNDLPNLKVFSSFTAHRVLIQLFIYWVYQYPGTPPIKGTVPGTGTWGRARWLAAPPPPQLCFFTEAPFPEFPLSPLPSSLATLSPPCHCDPLTLFLPSFAWDLHSHSQSVQNLPIPYATSSLESILISPGRNDFFPLKIPHNFFCCCFLMEFTSFCLRINPLPDFQSHLREWPRLIHFGISTLPGPRSY